MNTFAERSDASGDVPVCPECGTSSIDVGFETERFTYGVGDDAVQLEATLPLFTCRNCGYAFFPPDAEEAKHDAICDHLGVLRPRDIVATREKHGMTRSLFAVLTRFGDASLGRWERGALVQNGANDQLLYLLWFPDNVERLRARSLRRTARTAGTEAPISPSPRFPAIAGDNAITAQAQYFSLHIG
jgi:DNA-binding transcriptional regulator YiaG